MSGTTKLMTAGGGGVSLTPASSISSDVTVNVPSQNCTLGIQGPAFSAVPNSTQSITGGVATKMQFNVEEFDTANCYDNATNYRFTPNVAGYYQVNGAAEGSAGTQNYYLCILYKNGAQFKYGNNFPASAAAGPTAAISTLVYMNGSTDYLELYAIGTNNWTRGLSSLASYFQASLVRAA